MTQLQTDFDTPDASPGFLLWQISNKWQAQQRRALQPFGLTHVQFVLLACLTWSDHDGSITQKQLAGRAQTDVMMTSQVIRTLERKGLIARWPNPQDRRAMTLRPTEKGIELVNRAIKVVEAVDRDFFNTLDLDRPSFIQFMQRLNA
jgi:DNA-binding MarR family transcriptional regulator